MFDRMTFELIGFGIVALCIGHGAFKMLVCRRKPGLVSSRMRIERARRGRI